MKQKEQLAAQEQKLEELKLKIEDVETLLDDVSDAAYDKAVEVVTDTVRQETHKEDIRLVEESKNGCFRRSAKLQRRNVSMPLSVWMGSLPKSKRHAARSGENPADADAAGSQASREGAGQEESQRIHYGYSGKGKINADRDNRERWEREGRIAPTKKNDIEL